MKKLLAITLVASMAFVSYGQGPSIRQVPQSFINGFGMLILTNNTTITNTIPSWAVVGNGTTNYMMGGPSNLWYASVINILGGNVITNVQSGTTNAGGLLYPGAFRDVSVVPDANADVATGSIVVVLNNTNVYFDANLLNVVNYTNPPTVLIPATACTNTVTIQLIPSKDGINFSTLGSDVFTFTATAFTTNAAGTLTGTVPTVTSTNLPSAFMQNCKKIRATQIINNNCTSSTGTIISSLYFVQPVP